jgi:ribosomal protein L40E
MILPDWDKGFIDQKLKRTDISICRECGARKPDDKKANGKATCTNCGAHEWTYAMESK